MSESSSVNIRAILLWMLYFRYGLLLYKSILPQPAVCVRVLSWVGFTCSGYCFTCAPTLHVSIAIKRGKMRQSERATNPSDSLQLPSPSAGSCSSLFWLVLSHYSNSIVLGHLLKTKSHCTPPAWRQTANCSTPGGDNWDIWSAKQS